jgi:putative Mn2+ efflux pump MntP
MARIIIIGAVTFCLSLFGVYLGEAVGNRFENKIEAAGWVILIGIGIKVLIEHLFF